MKINDFLKTVTNKHIASLIERKIDDGCSLIARANDSLDTGGRYICGHGGYTVLEVS